MKRHLADSGFSLIEVMVASAILAIILASTLTFISGTETKNTFSGQVQKQNACIAEASKIISNIKEKGHSRYNAHYPASRLLLNQYNYTANTDLDQLSRSTQEYGLNFTERWTDPIYVDNGAGTSWTVRPELLIMGYMNTLQALYNSNSAAYCSAAGSNANATIVASPNSSILNTTAFTADANLRIQVYNIATGGAPTCPATVDIRPPNVDEANTLARTRLPLQENKFGSGANLSHPNDASLEVFNIDTSVQSDLGFIVTATVRYHDRNGNLKSCRVQEKFQYNTQTDNNLTLEFEDYEATINDTNTPEDINSTIITSNVANPPRYKTLNHTDYRQTAPSPIPVDDTPIFKGCDQGADTRNVTFRMTRTREGSIHMCRNLSRTRISRHVSAGGSWRHALQTDAAQFPGSMSGLYGFMFRTQLPMRNTFYSTELLRHVYWQGKEVDTPGSDLFATGLFYPAGSYYCVGVAGCGGSTTATPTADIISRAMPYFPHPHNTTGAEFAPGGTLNTHYVEDAGFRYYIPSNHEANTDLATQWQPCERLTTVCGSGTVAESRFYAGNETTTNLDAYQMRINNLPAGCEVHIQIAEVDAGYNIKTAEFKEYIQERAPGNKLCRNSQLANGRFNAFDPAGVGTWFFSCSTLYADAATAPTCITSSTGDCCIDYPFFPVSKQYVDPP